MSNILHNRTVTVFAGAFALMLLLCVFYGALLYILHSYQGALSDERKEVAVAQMEGHAFSTLARAHETLEAERAELRQYFIEHDDIVGFLEIVEDLGRSRGAGVSTAALTVVEGSGLTDELHLEVKVSGSHGAVFHVLELLETLPYKSHVSSAVIEQKGAEGGSGEWEGTFSIVVAKHKEL